MISLEEVFNILSNHKLDQLHCYSRSRKVAKEKADKDRQRELARNQEEEEIPSALLCTEGELMPLLWQKGTHLSQVSKEGLHSQIGLGHQQNS